MEKTIPSNSPWLAWGLAAAAMGFAAFCLASLTWDGSYYLFRTIQEGAPMVSNRRWIGIPVQMPLVWARPFASDPLQLAVLQGLLCSVLPLASLAVCLAMLRGAFAPLRFWAVFGILIAPLPGQIVLVSEANYALQWSWICLAFVWRGCPGAWAPVALLAGGVMWGIHPLSAPLYGLVAFTAAVMGFAVREKRARFWAWAALFGAAAAGKLAESVLLASPYERANMHGSAWVPEGISAALLTPFFALLPALAAPFVPRRYARWLWGLAFVAGLAYCLTPGGWRGALSYRKFGFVLAMPVVIAAAMEALRYWRSGVPFPAGSLRSPVLPALLFAVLFSAMSLSWRDACGLLRERLAAIPGRVETPADLPPSGLLRGLDHWSTTSLSLLLQGWSPQKVHVWDASYQVGPSGLCICPENPIEWTDNGPLKVGWVAGLRLPQAAPEATK